MDVVGRKEIERERERERLSLYNATRLKEWNRGWMNVMAERGIRLSGQRSGRKVPYKSKSGEGQGFELPGREFLLETGREKGS